MTESQLKAYASIVGVELGDGWEIRKICPSLWDEPTFKLTAPDGSVMQARLTTSSRGRRWRVMGLGSGPDMHEPKRPLWHCSVPIHATPETLAREILGNLWPRWSKWVVEEKARRDAGDEVEARRRVVENRLSWAYRRAAGVPAAACGAAGRETGPARAEERVQLSVSVLEPLVVRLDISGVDAATLEALMILLGRAEGREVGEETCVGE